MDGLVKGAVAGLFGTLGHTAVMEIGRWLDLMPVPAPEVVTSNLLRKTNQEEALDEPNFTATVIAGHFGYGIASGALYGLMRRILPGSPALSGTLFGTSLWAVSYFEVMPKLGLHPAPQNDAPGRSIVMALAHVVFGLVTARVFDMLTGGKQQHRERYG